MQYRLNPHWLRGLRPFRKNYCTANGAPGRIRTCDHPLRRRMLYPTELRAPGTTQPAVTLQLRLLWVIRWALVSQSCQAPLTVVVGVEGFEPPTLWSQTRCATKLRYTPTFFIWLSPSKEVRILPMLPLAVNAFQQIISHIKGLAPSIRQSTKIRAA